MSNPKKYYSLLLINNLYTQKSYNTIMHFINVAHEFERKQYIVLTSS